MFPCTRIVVLLLLSGAIRITIVFPAVTVSVKFKMILAPTILARIAVFALDPLEASETPSALLGLVTFALDITDVAFPLIN